MPYGLCPLIDCNSTSIVNTSTQNFIIGEMGAGFVLLIPAQIIFVRSRKFSKKSLMF